MQSCLGRCVTHSAVAFVTYGAQIVIKWFPRKAPEVVLSALQFREMQII